MGEYYMPAENEGKFQQLMNWIKDKKRPRPSFPRAIQIQTTSYCNAMCLFCGWKHTHNTQPQGHMEDDLFKKIIDETSKHFIGRVSPYLMNEPLMDKKLPERIAYIEKNKRPFTRTKINTNGALLTADMSERLIDSGLRHLWVSVQGYSEETYTKSMGIKKFNILENIDRFLDIRDKKGVKRPKVSITTLDTTIVHDELEYAQKHWAKRDVTFKIHQLDNRAGDDISGLSASKPKLKRDCDLFLKQAYVLFNGDVIICCHDWRRTVVLGNLYKNTLEEIWNSDHFISLIRQYYAGDFTDLKLCKTCTG